jgi:hypothetical protein
LNKRSHVNRMTREARLAHNLHYWLTTEVQNHRFGGGHEASSV